MEKSRDGRKTQTRYAPPESPGRAKQRAFMIAAAPEATALEELQELLRTAGVATVGRVVQVRDKPHANLYHHTHALSYRNSHSYTDNYHYPFCPADQRLRGFVAAYCRRISLLGFERPGLGDGPYGIPPEDRSRDDG